MKKLCIGCLSMVLVSFCTVPVWGNLVTINPYTGYYKPQFGEINQKLGDISKIEGMDLELKGGMIYGGRVGLDIGKFRLALDYGQFISETSDTRAGATISCEVKTNPAFLSIIYGASPEASVSPYIGAGIGKFFSKLTYTEKWVTNVISTSDKDDPTGYQALLGIEVIITENFALTAEGRYLWGKATFVSDAPCEYFWMGNSWECNWTGPTAAAGIEFKF